MVPELLYCIERLQSELSVLDLQGESASITSAVAGIAAQLRDPRRDVEAQAAAPGE